MPTRLQVDYATPEQFIEAVDLEVANGGLLVRGARPEPGETACVIEVRLAGELIAEFEANIGTVGRTGVALSFDDVPFELVAHADRLRAGLSRTSEAEPPPTESPSEPPAPAKPETHRGTPAERLAAMTVGQKMQAALTCERDLRIALLRDLNKAVHVFVLRNPRIEIDEVIFAARMTTLSPDALKFIGEHLEWGKNVQVMIALVRNPKTPMPIALKLLPKLPGNEIRTIAKGGARDQLMNAAKKMLAG